MKPIQRKNALMKKIETNHGEELEELLRRLFVDEARTHQEIENILSISHVTLIRWLRKAGIRHRRIDLGD